MFTDLTLQPLAPLPRLTNATGVLEWSHKLVNALEIQFRRPPLVGATGMSLTAAGTTQATAYAIAPTQTVSIFTGGASGAGVVLPPFGLKQAGLFGFVVNAGANNIVLYPNGTATINGNAPGAGVVIPAGTVGNVFVNAAGQVFLR